MLLITLRMDSLLDGVRPISNPLGSFWLAKVDYILQQLKEGKAVLTAESFQMVSQQTDKAFSHASLLLETHTTGLEGKMERLEADIEFQEELLRERKAELVQVRKKLRLLNKAAQDPQGDDPFLEAPLPVRSPNQQPAVPATSDAVES